MFEITEKRVIQADVGTVYRISTDLLNYENWNTWCIESKQEAVDKGYADITVLLGKQKMEVRHKILEIVENERFVWEDTGFFTYFSKGQRSRLFESVEGGTKYTCTLQVSGPLVSLTKLLYKKHLELGMKSEADALKGVAEKA